MDQMSPTSQAGEDRGKGGGWAGLALPLAYSQPSLPRQGREAGVLFTISQAKRGAAGSDLAFLLLQVARAL